MKQQDFNIASEIFNRIFKNISDMSPHFRHVETINSVNIENIDAVVAEASEKVEGSVIDHAYHFDYGIISVRSEVANGEQMITFITNS